MSFEDIAMETGIVIIFLIYLSPFFVYLIDFFKRVKNGTANKAWALDAAGTILSLGFVLAIWFSPLLIGINLNKNPNFVNNQWYHMWLNYMWVMSIWYFLIVGFINKKLKEIN